MLAERVCTSDAPNWLELRSTGIGASEMPVVLGLRHGLVELWLDKTGRKPRRKLDGEWIEWGHRLEGQIVEAFCERTKRAVRRSGELLRSPEHPWALATLDAWCAEDGEVEWPLEIKNVGTHRASAWEDGAPLDYVAQVHQQMLVTGCKRATIAALIGGQKLVWQDIERDETLTRQIIACGADFWRTNVVGDHPPDIHRDGAQAAKAALEALYRLDNGRTIILSRDLEDHFDRLTQIKAAMKALKDEETRLENDVRAALGEASRGVFYDGRAFSWNLQQRGTYVVPAAEYRVLRMHQAPKETHGRTHH
ncbi:MAG: YqaJ viral recombinase family protein [Myxococcales bacterium]|nr:YqaJ viral recombinase family protein [Myxococcales bacterium]